MINAIQLKKIATYDATGIEIKGLKKINFFYGSNGSGKTTVTKYLFDPNAAAYANCRITWASGQPVKLLVYNKDFRDRNFSSGSIDGVFTLGEATKEEAEKIEELKNKRRLIKEEGTAKKETSKKMEETIQVMDAQFRDELWAQVYKKYEDDFKEGFRGYINNKESFKTKFIEEFGNNKSKLHSLEKLKSFAKTIFGKKPLVLNEFRSLETDLLKEIESNELWSKKIIGKIDVDIATLIQKLNINDWVNQGRNFLGDNETCPFCQQNTITADFREQLEDYFDKSFVTNTGAVKQLAEDYNAFSLNLLNMLHGIDESEKENENSKLEIELFSAYLKTLETIIQQNNSLISEKLKEPSRSLKLKSTAEQIKSIAELFENANKAIFQHNSIANNYEKSKTELVGCLWKFVIEEYSLPTQNYIKKRDDSQKGLDGLQLKIDKLAIDWKALNKDIIERSKNLTSVQPSVDQINLTLKSYGFNNFKIVPLTGDDSKYQIQREDGELAEKTLSEGEITFITFLYFLQLTKGSVSQDNISEDRILVVDDPISSLDSNILFVISSLIRSVIQDIKAEKGNIKQLILFTHNVYFHKEVSFISSSQKECNQTNYWILRKHDKHTSLQCFDMKNPIKSSYELLWKEIRNRTECSTISIQNTMRRILENYFKILGGMSEINLVDKFSIGEQREICKSLMLWINDGSHSLPDDLFIEKQDDVVEKYYNVFKDIFVHTKHDQHFSMMMGEEIEI